MTFSGHPATRRRHTFVRVVGSIFHDGRQVAAATRALLHAPGTASGDAPLLQPRAASARARTRRRDVRAHAGLRLDDDAFRISPRRRDVQRIALAPGVWLMRPGHFSLATTIGLANDDFAENGSATFEHVQVQVEWWAQAAHDVRWYQLQMAAADTGSSHYRWLASECSDEHAFEEAL